MHEYTLRIPGATTRINLPLRGFVRRFNVSSLEEFSFYRKRQYSHNETDALKLRGNRERNFDGAVSSSLKTTFFLSVNSLFFIDQAENISLMIYFTSMW